MPRHPKGKAPQQTRALAGALIALLSLTASQALADLDRGGRPPTVRTVDSPPPRLDGRLEALWLAADPAADFVEVDPNEGRPAPLRTRVYLLHTDDALYAAFQCIDTAPDSIAGRIQRRDRTKNSDAVSIGLDTFHDRRNAYAFTVTAAGVQRDYVISSETDQDESWDGIWESAVARHDSGWVAEVRLPFSSFRHGNGAAHVWGVNFVRVVERHDSWYSWVPLERTEGNRVSSWGLLVGLPEIEGGFQAQLLPHAVGAWEQPDQGPWSSRTSWEGLGLDAKLVPSSTWTVDLTYQPDFAQVEVDDEVINLDPYPVYLEERRPFFLEGLSLFEDLPMNLFYTRKITDPEYGAKVTGSWGPLRSSALVARNETEEGRLQTTAAGRAKLHVGRTSTLGITTTWLDDDSLHAGVGGVDGTLRWGRQNYVSFLLAGVEKRGYTRQPLGAETALYLASGPWRGRTSVTYMGRDFDVNDLGFTRYSNKVSQYVWGQRRWYFGQSPFRAVYLNANWYNEAMPDGDLYEKSFNWNSNIQLRSNWWFGGGMNWGSGYYRYRPDEDEELNVSPKFSDNFGPFEPRWQVWYSRWLWLNSDSRKPVVGELSLEQGSFREGDRWGANLELTLKPRPNIELDGEIDWVRIDNALEVNDGAMTDFRIVRISARWSPTLHLSTRSTVQYVLEDEELLTNLLLAWQWNPGSWLYIVYDEVRESNFQVGLNPVRDPDWGHGDRSLQLKATWYVSLPG